jgi:hypothetical protein
MFASLSGGMRHLCRHFLTAGQPALFTWPGTASKTRALPFVHVIGASGFILCMS